MITAESLKAVGKFLKPHGINGEINLARDFDDIDFEDFSCIIVDIDGIFVPFFLESVRPKGADTDLVAIDGIVDELHAARLTNRVVYVLRSELSELREAQREESAEDYEAGDAEGFFADDLIGYEAIGEDGNPIGRITGIDDSTANYLFEISTLEGKKLLIPIADEFISGIDNEARRLELSLPEGLLEMQ